MDGVVRNAGQLFNGAKKDLTNAFAYDIKEQEMKKITPKLIKGKPKHDGIYLEYTEDGGMALVDIGYFTEIKTWTISDYPNFEFTDSLPNDCILFGPLNNVFKKEIMI